jgi:O-antigen/teichoic acid export membrane protein
VAEIVSEGVVATPGAVPSGRGAVIRASLLTMLAIGALGITRLVHSALVARATDKQTFAVVGIMIGVTMTAGLFLPGGISSASSKFIPYFLGRGEAANARAAYGLLAKAGYLCSVALAVIAGIGMFVYGVGVADAIAVALLTAVFSIYSVEKAALYGFDRVQEYVRLELIGSACAIIATVIVVLAHWHVYLLPLALGYSILIAGSLLLLRRPALPPGEVTITPEHRREMRSYIGLASIGGLASAGLLQALPLIADSLTTHTDVAYFAAGIALVAPLYFLPRALGMALFPAMAHAHGAGDMDVVRRHTDISTRALFVLLAPLFVIAVFLARPILALAYGLDYSPGAKVLQVLLAATFLMVTQVAAVNALSSGTPHDVRIPVLSAVAGWVAGVVSAIPLGLMLGGFGIGLAYLIAAAVSASGPLFSVARRHSLAWQRPIGRAMLVLLGALVVSLVVDGYPVTHSTWYLLDAGVGLAAGAIAAFVLYGDIKGIIRRRV